MTCRLVTRRTFLKASATLPLATLPGITFGAAGPDRSFLFLLAPGGWDSTLVFEPRCSRCAIDMPAGSRLETAGGLRWTSAPGRPSVDRFFREWGHRVAIVNGIHTPSLGHAAATNLLFTGDVAPGRPDWPALLGRATEPVSAPPPGGTSFSASLWHSVDALRTGRSHCELLKIPGTWDTHYDNTPQSGQLERFFHDLGRLFHEMSRTPGRRARNLLDEVVVVALSELGRTPRHNEAGGKDHWPFTSALVAGAGVAGARVVGATDGGLEARAIDFRTGLPAQSGDIIQSENLGAALLRMGGLSPRKLLPGVQVLDALLG